MHMAATGAIGHFYHIQLTLPHTGTKRHAYLFNGFHQVVFHWRQLWQDFLNLQTFMAEVVQYLPNALGLCDTLGLGDGSDLIGPDRGWSRCVWRLALPRDTVEELVSWSKLWGKITNYYLELVVLVLQQSCFCDIWSYHQCNVPAAWSNNTPTVIWTFCKSSAVNPAVVYLLRLRLICNRDATIMTSVFFHPGLENTMDNDASCQLDLPNL